MQRTIWVGALVLFFVFAPSVHAQTATTTDALATTTTILPFDPLNTDDVEAYVRREFADVPVMIRIAKCESGFRQFDSSGNPLYGGTGGMAGVFQIAAALHNDAARGLQYNINTLDGNLGYARYLYETEGVVPWLASSGCWGLPIKTTLKVGSKGKAVLALQQMLNRIGYLVAKGGEGSPGQESSVYGPMTAAAVKRFQCDVKLACSGNEKTTGYGMVGSKTRLALLRADAKVSLQAHTKNLTQN